MTVAEALFLTGWALAGAGVGAAFFLALRRNVALYLGGRSRWRAAALHLARLGLAAGGFALAAAAGAGPLLAALAGFLAARVAVLRFAGGAPC